MNEPHLEPYAEQPAQPAPAERAPDAVIRISLDLASDDQPEAETRTRYVPVPVPVPVLIPEGSSDEPEDDDDGGLSLGDVRLQPGGGDPRGE